MPLAPQLNQAQTRWYTVITVFKGYYTGWAHTTKALLRRGMGF